MGEFPVETRVLGRYRIESELGSGGMAQVFSVFDEKTRRELAIKTLRSDKELTQERRKRFLHEFDILSRLQHPSIVSVYDCHETESGTPFFTMEKIPGKSLAWFLKNTEENTFSTQELLSILLDIAQAIAYLHEQGIIYRDVKPDNIILSTSSDPEKKFSVKLIDFGISVECAGLEQTANTMPGTSAYMSPEQIRGDRIDARSDMYSFGMLSYELLSGALPFSSDAEFTVAAFHLLGEVSHLPSRNKDIPKNVQLMTMVCLEKNASDRYTSMHEVARYLEVEMKRYKEKKNRNKSSIFKRLFR